MTVEGVVYTLVGLGLALMMTGIGYGVVTWAWHGCA